MGILITGGAGFIGSHLAEELVKREDEVYIIDNLSTGNLQNIWHLLDARNFHFIEGDIRDKEVVIEVMKKCREVYHLAAVVGVKRVVEDPLETLSVNVVGTEVILSCALKIGCKVVIASTSEVYGKDARNVDGKFKEVDDLTFGTKLRWGYAASKAVDEYLARAYWEQRGLPVIIIRYFNTVGPRQTGAYGMVIPRFVEQALKGLPITIFGDGRQTRTFCHVKDTIEATIELMKRDEAIGEIFNVGGKEVITINELAKKIKKKTNSPSKIVYIPYEKVYSKEFEDIRHRSPDISKVQSIIGFEPKRGIDEIIEEVIDYKMKKGK